MEELDYRDTLNLPKTDFSMRANLAQKEPEMVKKWDEERLYYKLIDKNAGKPKFVLHDGPPFANGDIHLGHSLNKILKDIIVRYKNMSGFQSPYVPGWDTHGLPIEVKAIKKLKVNRDEMDISEFRKICRDFALGYIDNQKEQFKRLGVLGDFDDPYITLKPEFEAKQIKVFGKMAEKNFIYKGLKPVYWCTDCETALAEAEIEYQEDQTDSIYVKFAVKDDKGVFDGFDKSKIFFVIWTTTTWTLPGNVAISLNPHYEYVLMHANDEYYVVAKELAQTFAETVGIENYEIAKELVGADMEYITCAHPFLDRDSLVIVGEHVTLDAGTGCVHTAPGFGADDFIACSGYDVPMVVPVDSKGYQTKDAGQFAGMYYAKSNEPILEQLKSTNSLLKIEPIMHQYPHCWRCSNPIIFRATEQWFASVEGFKKDAIDAIEKVKWYPKWGEDRIKKMVEDRNDWCISRQRKWGVPLPIFYCKECGHELINSDTIDKISNIFREKGSDAWYQMDASELVPDGAKCEKCGCTEFTKEEDIMDVWFDSGSSHYAVCEGNEKLAWPADLYLEGNDQYRGWFQSSLLTSVAMGMGAPYKAVVTHGFIIDEERRKMSKSLGNGINPLDVANKYGIDILRLWVVSADYQSDIRISEDMLKQISESYRKIRNTARYMLGNLSDFNPDSDMVAYSDMQEIDRFALLKVNDLVRKVRGYYDSYDFHLMQVAIHRFCVLDMSNFYLDIIKDRLYTQSAESAERRSAQTAMYIILDSLVRLLTPVLCFTSEEIWKAMPHKSEDDTQSVMFNDMPEPCDQYDDTALEEKYEIIRKVRNDVSKALEIARQDKVIGHSLGAKVQLFADGRLYDFLKENENALVTLFIISAAGVSKLNEAPDDTYIAEDTEGLKIEVTQARGDKCERCWMFSETVGQDSEHPKLCKRCADVVKKIVF